MDKPRAVLDTNMFYYAAGVYREPRLHPDWLERLEATHTLALSSPTIAEILTRSELDESQLWICLEEVFSGRYTDCIQIGYLPVKIATLDAIVRSRNTTTLRLFQSEVLRARISCEASFLKFVFVTFFSGFLHALGEDRRAKLRDEQRAHLNVHFKSLIEGNIELIETELLAALTDGYASGDVKDRVEGAFYQLLRNFADAGLRS